MADVGCTLRGWERARRQRADGEGCRTFLSSGPTRPAAPTSLSFARAIAESGGTEVKNLGDGLMFVFGPASAGIACAAIAQF